MVKNLSGASEPNRRNGRILFCRCCLNDEVLRFRSVGCDTPEKTFKSLSLFVVSRDFLLNDDRPFDSRMVS
jgi:hypothetical protein